MISLPTRHTRRSGFTIVELLVVIGVIAVLAGLLLPALGGAQRKARKTEEINRIRQVGVAFTLYASSNDDQALPGFLPASVQERWRVRSKFPDGSAVPREVSESYPWRIMNYLDHDPGVLLGYRGFALDSKLDLQNDQVVDPAFSPSAMVSEVPEYKVDTPRPTTLALQPAFAYNAYHVGGWWEYDENEPDERPRRRFDLATSLPEGTRTNVISKSPSSIRNSTEVIVFCSATLAEGEQARAVDDRPGAHFITPPTLGTQPRWRRAVFGPNGESSDTIIEVFSASGGDGTFAAPIGRYTGQVAVLAADMHTSTDQPGSLDDQRRWIDAADRRDYTFSE